jgi:hypothetical protein
MAAWLLLTRDVAHCHLLKYSIDFGKKDPTFLIKLKVCSSVLPIVIMFPPEAIYVCHSLHGWRRAARNRSAQILNYHLFIAD